MTYRDYLLRLPVVVMLLGQAVVAAEDQADPPQAPWPEDIVAAWVEVSDSGESQDRRDDGHYRLWAPETAERRASRWTVRADVLFLERSRPREAVLVSGSASKAGPVLLDAADFTFNAAPGFDINLTRHHLFDSSWGVEARYLGIDGWNASRGAVHSPTGAVVQFAVPIGNLTFPADVAAEYQSRLRSVECNARRELTPDLTLLAGFRYLDLSEMGLAIADDVLAAATNHVQCAVDASNRLAGFQMGADARLWFCGPWQVDGLLKAGVYQNHAANRVRVIQTGPSFASDATFDRAAFVGELALSGAYRINRFCTVRAGYQLLWLDGVALASDQVAASNPLVGAASVNGNGTPVYFGGFAGIEVRR